MLRVGLLWHSLTSANLGVRALTLAELALLETAAGRAGRTVEVALFGHPDLEVPPVTFEGRHLRFVEPLHLTASALFRRPAEVLAAFRRCDLLIDIGEGDSFTDVYGVRRYVKQLASKVLALRSGRPLILAPQTIGPFRHGRRLPPAAILRAAEQVFVRDAESAAFARRISHRRDMALSSDIAFLLPWDRPPPRSEGAPVRIGVNVSGLLYGRRNFGLAVPYDRLIDTLLTRWSTDPRCEVHLVEHVLDTRGDPDQDIAVGEVLARRFPTVGRAPRFADPRAVKSWIAGLDFFVGARMHACIAAFSAGVPLVPLAYTRKATGLFNALGYDATVDLRTGSLDTAVAAVIDGFERRSVLARRVAAGNLEATARLKLYTDAIDRLVASA